MRKLFDRGFLIALGTVSLLACSSSDVDNPTVTVKQDQTTDLTQYTTYALADGSTLPPDVLAEIPTTSRANIDTVNSLVGAQLMNKGLTQVALGANPGLVAYSFIVTSDMAAISYTCSSGVYYYTYWAYSYDPCAFLQPLAVTYSQGNVIVALVDPVARKVVFGGLIQGSIPDDPGDKMTKLENGVSKMFESFP